MATAKISIARNFKSLPDIALVTKEDMREIGLLARERIIRRTRQAQGPDGPFQGLSPVYAEQKHKALGGAPRPDLTVSGNMLNHMGIVDVTENTVTLGWNQ